MLIPSDYIQGYRKAHTISPLVADNYVAHTLIGDPKADALVEELAPRGQRETSRLIHTAMVTRDQTDAPQRLIDFFTDAAQPPEWIDLIELEPACRMFQRNSRLVLGAFVGGALVEGFSTNISRSFNVTGRLRHEGVRRLRQNIRHLAAIFEPQGLSPGKDGWKLSLRIRLIHAQVRRLLLTSDEWDTEAWGAPLSAAHLGLSITAFSARMLRHMKSLGAIYDEEERKSFMDVWRYTGYLMGIPETILFREEDDALQLFEIGRICEPTPEWDSIITANSLINSAPLVVGITEPMARRKLTKYVYSVSRAIIGKQLADELRYPSTPTSGVLLWFRLQAHYNRLMEKYFPNFVQVDGLPNTADLAGEFASDEPDTRYALPRHSQSEKSGTW